MAFGTTLDSAAAKLFGTESKPDPTFDLVVEIGGERQAFTAEIKGDGDAATLDVYTERGDRTNLLGKKPDVAFRRQLEAWLEKHGKEIIAARQLYTDGKSDNNADRSLSDGRIQALYQGMRVCCDLNRNALGEQYGNNLVAGFKESVKRREEAAPQAPQVSAEQRLKGLMGEEEAAQYAAMLHDPAGNSTDLMYTTLRADGDHWVVADQTDQTTGAGRKIPRRRQALEAQINQKPGDDVWRKACETTYRQALESAVKLGLVTIDNPKTEAEGEAGGIPATGLVVYDSDGKTILDGASASEQDAERHAYLDQLRSTRSNAAEADSPLVNLTVSLKRLGMSDEDIFAVVRDFVEKHTLDGKFDPKDPQTVVDMRQVRADYVGKTNDERNKAVAELITALQGKSEQEVKKTLRETLAAMDASLATKPGTKPGTTALDDQVDVAWEELKKNTEKKPSEFHAMSEQLRSEKLEDRKAGRQAIASAADKTYSGVQSAANAAQDEKVVREQVTELIDRLTAKYPDTKIPDEFSGSAAEPNSPLTRTIKAMAQELTALRDPKTGELDEARAYQYMSTKLRRMEERVDKYVKERYKAELWKKDRDTLIQAIPGAFQSAQRSFDSAARELAARTTWGSQPTDRSALNQQAERGQELLSQQVKASNAQKFLETAQSRGNDSRPAPIPTPGPSISSPTATASNFNPSFDNEVESAAKKARRRSGGGDDGQTIDDFSRERGDYRSV